jgi:hypothetical protein
MLLMKKWKFMALLIDMSCLPTQKKRTAVSVISGDDTVNFPYRIDALETQANNIIGSGY